MFCNVKLHEHYEVKTRITFLMKSSENVTKQLIAKAAWFIFLVRFIVAYIVDFFGRVCELLFILWTIRGEE